MRTKLCILFSMTLLISVTNAIEYTVTVRHPVGMYGYNLISFPVLPADASLNNTIGAQVPVYTTIMWFQNETGGFIQSGLRSDGQWNPNIQLERGKGYYLVLRSNAPLTSYPITIEGDTAIAATWDMGTIGVGYNMIGSVWYSPHDIAQSNLYESGFRGGANPAHSDLIRSFDNNSFQSVSMNNMNNWVIRGAFTSFQPGKGYFILRRGGRTPPSFPWINTRN